MSLAMSLSVKVDLVFTVREAFIEQSQKMLWPDHTDAAEQEKRKAIDE